MPESSKPVYLCVWSGEAETARQLVRSRYPKARVEEFPHRKLRVSGFMQRIRLVRGLRGHAVVFYFDSLDAFRHKLAVKCLHFLHRCRETVLCDQGGRWQALRTTDVLRSIPEVIFSLCADGWTLLTWWVYLHFLAPHPLALSPDRSGEPEIAYLIPNPASLGSGGGAISHIRGVLSGLDAAGKSCRVFTGTALAQQAFKNELIAAANRPYFFWGAVMLSYNITFARGVQKSLGDQMPGAFYQRHFAFSIAGALLSRRLQVPLILEYNGSQVWIAHHWDPNPLHSWIKLCETAALRSASRIIVVSEALREDLLHRGIQAERILVNPNAVDPDFFCPGTLREKTRGDLAVNAEEVLIGFVGSFSFWHGIEVLQQAILRLLSSEQSVRLRFVLVGHGLLHGEMCSALAAHEKTGQAIFTGMVSQEKVVEYLDAADILVSPHVPMPDGSRFFGSPTKLFEYMAMGKGIIASRLEQIAEVLEHEQTAWLVTPGDAEELADAILRLALDPKKRAALGAAARRAAIERHSWAHNVANALDDMPVQRSQFETVSCDSLKLRAIANALRNEPLPILFAEGVWRSTREIQKRIFARTGPGLSKVGVHPLGYYDAQPEMSSGPIVAYADAVLRGEFPLLGYGCPNLGVEPDWHRDWVSGKSWPLVTSGNIQTVRHDGSDVKAPWELSRLQFAPVVAQAWSLTKAPRYREFLKSLVTHWIVSNPLAQGVNWTIAMEAALRGISLCLTIERLWPFSEQEKPWLDQITDSLWQHLRFIEVHSEFSFRVRSNHYLSNLAGLTTLSAYLRGPGMERRLRKYSRALQREILSQTYEDGGDCEASTGYHLLVAQMGLHSFAVQQQRKCSIAPEFHARLRLMFDWLASVADDTGKLPLLGDCDNGRVELLPDDIAQAMQAAGQGHALHTGSLQTQASLLLEAAPEAHTLLRPSGIAVLRAGEASVVFSAMPNGLAGKGSHTHCDKLAVVLRLGPEEVFCDSGSRCYSRSAHLRNLDRSTRAHSTLIIDGIDQNTIPSDPGKLFQCGNEAAVSAITVSDGKGASASHYGYAGLGMVHHRSVQLSEHGMLVTDEVSESRLHVLDLSTRDLHTFDLRFVLGPGWRATPASIEGETVRCAIDGARQLTMVCAARSRLSLSVQAAEISRAYGSGLPASCILIHTTASLPARIETSVEWE